MDSWPNSKDGVWFDAVTSKCTLCYAPAKPFLEEPTKKYYQCERCSAVFLDPGCYLSAEEERLRYQKHNNDVEDPGYQRFVDPIVSAVEERFDTKQRGLDFGSGTGPVAAKLLRERGYRIELYDPFFCNDPQALKERYDFIVCCEVMEHFHFPAKEFGLLRSLLEPEGALFCMTELFSEAIDFKTWYYRNDETHVFFYHQKTLRWIQSQFGFSALEHRGRLVRFFC